MAVYYRQIEERKAETKREEGLKGKNWRLKGLKRMKSGVISENGKQFVAEAFQRLCRGKTCHKREEDADVCSIWLTITNYEVNPI